MATIYGDTSTSLSCHQAGGDQFIQGDDGVNSYTAVYNYLYGDAYSMRGFAHGGNDTILGGSAGILNEQIYGDAYVMRDFTQGGNDLIVGGSGDRQDNCQVAVSLSVANDQASLPIAYQLYLPEAWAADPARRARAGVPEAVVFATKPAIALGQIRQALADGVPAGVVLGDAGYGDETGFRVGVGECGLDYVLGIRAGTTVWPTGMAPLPPASWSGQGRPPTRVRRSPHHQPVSVKQLAQRLRCAST